MVSSLLYLFIPVSIAGEIARLENINGDRRYDDEMLRSVEGLSKIILAKDAEMWLLNIPSHRINEFVSTNHQGLNEAQSMEVIQYTLDKFRNSKANRTILEREITEVVEADHQEQPVMLPITRSRRDASNSMESNIDTPAANSIVGIPQGETTDSGKMHHYCFCKEETPENKIRSHGSSSEITASPTLRHKLLWDPQRRNTCNCRFVHERNNTHISSQQDSRECS